MYVMKEQLGERHSVLAKSYFHGHENKTNR